MQGRWRKSFFIIAAIVLLSAGASAEQPFTIGLNTTLSGGAAAYGLHNKMGAELAVEEINAAGGIKGAKIELIIDDNKASPTEAVAIAKKTLSNCQATIVGSTGSAFLAVMPVATELKVPMVAAALGTVALTEKNNPWVFRVSANDRKQGWVMADYLVSKRSKKSIGIIHDSNDYGVGGRNAVETYLTRKNVKPVDIETFNMGELNFTPNILRLKESKADAVVAWGLQKELSLIVKKWAEFGKPFELALGSAVDTEVFAGLAGPAADGVPYSIFFFMDLKNPKIKEFHDKFQKKFNMNPDLYSTLTYDSIYIIAEAFKKAGRDTDRVRQALQQTHHAGVGGELKFDPSGDSVRDIFVLKWVYKDSVPHREKLAVYTNDDLLQIMK